MSENFVAQLRLEHHEDRHLDPSLQTTHEYHRISKSSTAIAYLRHSEERGRTVEKRSVTRDATAIQSHGFGTETRIVQPNERTL